MLDRNALFTVDRVLIHEAQVPYVSDNSDKCLKKLFCVGTMAFKIWIIKSYNFAISLAPNDPDLT